MARVTLAPVEAAKLQPLHSPLLWKQKDEFKPPALGASAHASSLALKQVGQCLQEPLHCQGGWWVQLVQLNPAFQPALPAVPAVPALPGTMVLQVTAPPVPLRQIVLQSQPGHSCPLCPWGNVTVLLRRWMVPGALDGIQEWESGLRNQHPTTKHCDLAYRCLWTHSRTHAPPAWFASTASAAISVPLVACWISQQCCHQPMVSFPPGSQAKEKEQRRGKKTAIYSQ